MPPELPGIRELVRRRSGQDLGVTVLVESEQLGIGFHIGRISDHEDGNVTEQQDATVPCMPVHVRPLVIEHELEECLVVTVITNEIDPVFKP